MTLEGKVIVVTGAGQGIGRAMARRLMAGGAKVVAVARTDEHLQSLAAESPAGRMMPYRMDVRSYEQAQEMAAAAVTWFGRIDGIVNNAGWAHPQRLVDMESEVWQQTIDVNLTGIFNCTKAVLPHMLERAKAEGGWPAGQILNIASVMGRNATKGSSVYSMTKAGVIHLTECWKLELEPEGIRVMCLAPGLTQTDFGGRPASSKPGGKRPETVAEVAWQMLTLPGDATMHTLFLPHTGAAVRTQV